MKLDFHLVELLLWPFLKVEAFGSLLPSGSTGDNEIQTLQAVKTRALSRVKLNRQITAHDRCFSHARSAFQAKRP